MKSAYSIGKIFGIPVKIHVSWILIFIYVVWALAGDYYNPEQIGGEFFFYLGLSIVVAFLFFASILLHEIAHSLVAKKCGVEVKSITLHLFGGQSTMSDNVSSAKSEFLISIAGPLTNVVIGIVFLIISGIFYGNPYWLSDSAWWLGYINLITAIFNLIPGFPMDGGRIVRAVIWGKTKDIRKATKLTCDISKVFGVLTGLLGIYVAVRIGLSTAVWLFFLTWMFLNSSKDMKEYTEQQVFLDGIPISKYVHNNYITVMTYDKVSYVVRELQKHDTHQAILVVKDNKIVGTIDEKEVWKKQLEDHNILVSDFMHPIETAHILAEYEPELMTALMQQSNMQDLPVIAEHRMIGFINSEKLNCYINECAHNN